MPRITSRQARRTIGRSSAIPRSRRSSNLSSVALAAGAEYSLCTHVWGSMDSNRSTASTASTASYNSSSSSVMSMDSLQASLPGRDQQEDDSWGFFVDCTQ
mmetsp:Transcript_37719/g.82819  ORF Transcript_37719/g.82819 Transcript_37719/m.82819 type:complete len:101 (-) Transcript_37719:400-702(-)|eukprot:CAMPEP_0178551940 /NCGR_PEP_ID=MMETSP0697-20121206/7041_1 /TAXON_ID=265572 /ORGANISM="Extubocellulus spinifer, Strain CCMP396" /LENGTH=100 /DNA_ID=CAMNT_0020184803 /DNA_START=22 /DNA_END=324 /DNA_ORIENTATION=+